MERTDKGAGAADVANAINDVIKATKNEPKRRGDFVKTLLDGVQAKKPGFHVIVFHPKHTYKFEGERGRDWGHHHAEYRKDATPGTIGFEIYWFKKGVLENNGDGGWENWGYTGNPKREGNKLTYA